MTDERLAEIERRVEAASGGIWYWASATPMGEWLSAYGLTPDGGNRWIIPHGDRFTAAEGAALQVQPGQTIIRRAEADLIAFAAQDLRDLLHEVRALQERLSADFARAGELVG